MASNSSSNSHRTNHTNHTMLKVIALSVTAVTLAAAILGVASLGTAGAEPPGAADRAGQAAPRTGETARSTGDVPIPTLPRPEDFVTHVTNAYLPLKPGTRWVYRSVTADGVEVIKVTVLARTKQIQGITATVVHDLATLDGNLIEDTYDWYAQDRLGSVWYLGEDTTSYEPGQPPSHKGSWEAGVERARPGFAMPAHTAVGETYRQEYKQGDAEDMGTIIDRSGRVHVTTGSYHRVLMTKDTTPLEPNLIEYKFYAPGVGQVLELGTNPDLETVQLVKFVKP